MDKHLTFSAKHASIIKVQKNHSCYILSQGYSSLTQGNIMKKLFATLVLGLALVASQSVMAAETGFYGVVGVGQMVNNNLPIMDHERQLIQYDGGVRKEDSTSLAKNFSMGYQFNKNWAVEGGYLSSTSGAATTGSVKSTWGEPQTPINVPYFFTHRRSFAALHVSAVGTYHVNEFVGLYGKLGVMKSSTTTDSRTAFSWPGNDGGYHGNSTSEKSTRGIVGLGVTMKMTKNVDLRVGIEHMGKAIPTASLIVRL